MRVRYLSAARQDPQDAVRWYNAERPGLGRDRRSEVRAAIERIKRFPRAWQQLDSDIRAVPDPSVPLWRDLPGAKA